MSKAKSLKNYLAFIPLRLAYLRIADMKQSNEYKFYLALYNHIREYLKSDRIFLRYLTGKIDIKKYNAFYKKSERTSYRIFIQTM